MFFFFFFFFFFNDTATTEIYTLSLHDALPISSLRKYLSMHLRVMANPKQGKECMNRFLSKRNIFILTVFLAGLLLRSEEHTSELQSLAYLVCRLLLEKKKKKKNKTKIHNN